LLTLLSATTICRKERFIYDKIYDSKRDDKSFVHSDIKLKIQNLLRKIHTEIRSYRLFLSRIKWQLRSSSSRYFNKLKIQK